MEKFFKIISFYLIRHPSSSLQYVICYLYLNQMPSQGRQCPVYFSLPELNILPGMCAGPIYAAEFTVMGIMGG